MLTYCWNTEVAGARAGKSAPRDQSQPPVVQRGWEQLAHHSLNGYLWTGGVDNATLWK